MDRLKSFARGVDKTLYGVGMTVWYCGAIVAVIVVGVYAIVFIEGAMYVGGALCVVGGLFLVVALLIVEWFKKLRPPK